MSSQFIVKYDESLAFEFSSKELFRVTSDGRIILGAGLSADEATAAAAELLVTKGSVYVQQLHAERDKFRDWHDKLHVQFVEMRGRWQLAKEYAERLENEIAELKDKLVRMAMPAP
jgi:hypothetical protein